MHGQAKTGLTFYIVGPLDEDRWMDMIFQPKTDTHTPIHSSLNYENQLGANESYQSLQMSMT